MKCTLRATIVFATASMTVGALPMQYQSPLNRQGPYYAQSSISPTVSLHHESWTSPATQRLRPLAPETSETNDRGKLVAPTDAETTLGESGSLKPGTLYYVWKDIPSKTPKEPVPHNPVDQNKRLLSTSRKGKEKLTEGTSPSSSASASAATALPLLPGSSTMEMSVAALRRFTLRIKARVRKRLKALKHREFSEEDYREQYELREQLPYVSPHFKDYEQWHQMKPEIQRKWLFAIELYREYEEKERLRRPSSSLKSDILSDVIRRKKEALRQKMLRQKRKGKEPRHKDALQHALISSYDRRGGPTPSPLEVANLSQDERELWLSIHNTAEKARNEEKELSSNKRF